MVGVVEALGMEEVGMGCLLPMGEVAPWAWAVAMAWVAMGTEEVEREPIKRSRVHATPRSVAKIHDYAIHSYIMMLVLS